MKKINILFTLVVLLAMIPLTYVIGRGGGHGGGHGGGGRGGYSHSGHRGGYGRHGGYYGRGGYSYNRYGYYNPARWVIPAIATTEVVAAAAASAGSGSGSSAPASESSRDDTTYYPEDYDTDTEYVVEDTN
jgi:hypothetical protein